MKINKQVGSAATVTPEKQRSYNEIVEFLDANWNTNTQDTTLNNLKQLDKALGSVSTKVNTILVAGSNGKSLTINFATPLLQAEGLTVGAFYMPHLLTYNERFAINKEHIANKAFTDLGNEVLNAAKDLTIELNSLEILTMMALLYFNANKVDVALLEVSNLYNAPTICNAKITAITRITADDAGKTGLAITQMLELVKAGTHVISADQSKLSLQTMLTMVESKGAIWEMPIRKLAQLNYPFEQLHGRCAALAERIAQIYVNTILSKDSIVVSGSLLTKQKGQRGRPTLEAKRQQELNPRKTIEQFWKETEATLPARFQLLDKEKPTILLDNATNLDAFENLLLGIRLLYYQRPLKGLTLVIGCNNPDLNMLDFLKALRYFFKKTSGQVIVCPTQPIASQNNLVSWDVEKVTNEIKGMKIKAKSAKSFKDAFDMAQKSVDERNGLVVVTGSSAIITEYWQHKDIKKL